MCELFGLASRLPTIATISLERFAARGGLDYRTLDGWGLALLEGRDLRLYREPEPARDSAWLAFIQTRRMRARFLVSHIRHATRGAVALANTQPIVREIAGRMHCFAHNGQLSAIERKYAAQLERFRPVGKTDSEYAACVLFERIARLWTSDDPPPVGHRLETVADFAAEMRELGPANFLYCDGLALFAHGHRRMHRAGRIAPPGLWRLHRDCAVDRDALADGGVRLEPGGPPGGPQEIALIASVPLTGEEWKPLGEGEVIVI